MKKTCLLLSPSWWPVRALVEIGVHGACQGGQVVEDPALTGSEVQLVSVIVGADEEDVLAVLSVLSG